MANLRREASAGLQERWHWKKAVSALITGLYGIWAIFSSSWGNGSQFDFHVRGVIIIIVVLAATIVTRFWTHYQSLSLPGKTLAWAAFLPGAVVFWVIFGSVLVVLVIGRILLSL